MRDSNPRHPRCKRGALPTELIALDEYNLVRERGFEPPHLAIRTPQIRASAVPPLALVTSVLYGSELNNSINLRCLRVNLGSPGR
jgi:hypothetical protein